MKKKQQASDELLSYLPRIADLLKTHRQGDGEVVKRMSLKDYTIVCLYKVPSKCVNELGAILERIADGEDAYKLLRQNERTKPNKQAEHRAIAVAYYSTWAQNFPARDAKAKARRKARSLFPEMK